MLYKKSAHATIFILLIISEKNLTVIEFGKCTLVSKKKNQFCRVICLRALGSGLLLCPSPMELFLNLNLDCQTCENVLKYERNMIFVKTLSRA